MKLTKKHTILLLLFLTITVTLSFVVSKNNYKQKIQNNMERARLNAEIYSDRIQQDLHQGIVITETLKRIIEDEGGIHDFETTAKKLLKDYVSSIQLAPKGKVTEIYPLKGNEAGKIDLLNDPTRGPIVSYGIEHDTPTMQGPFSLKQGGQGIAIRTPVFMPNPDGSKTFWGLAIVIIKSPEIYERTLASLASFGFEYSLSVTPSPLSEDLILVKSSTDSINEKFLVQRNFQIGECTWSITISPFLQTGLKGSAISICENLAYALLVTLMFYLLLILLEQKSKLKAVAFVDELTGLLSRRGFMAQLDKIFKDEQTKLMLAFIDLDDFKSINDVHGHAAGDEALKALAQQLRKCFPKNSIIGRTGGDEFCVVIQDESYETCKAMIEKAVSAKHSFRVGDEQVYYTMSIGYANYPSDAKTQASLMVRADEALYAAKLDGKNNCKHFKKEMSNIKRSQLGFSTKSFAAGIPGALLVYRAHKDEQILFANEDLIKLFECKDYEDFLAYTNSSFKNVVYPPDLEHVEKSIWNQIEKRKKADSKKAKLDDFVEYRILTKSSKVKEVVDVGRLIHDENYGEIFFVFIREKSAFEQINK